MYNNFNKTIHIKISNEDLKEVKKRIAERSNANNNLFAETQAQAIVYLNSYEDMQVITSDVVCLGNSKAIIEYVLIVNGGKYTIIIDSEQLEQLVNGKMIVARKVEGVQYE